MEIDDILAGVDTAMTEGLIRLFKSAGCSPTACHVCTKTIKNGDIFKLIAFKGTDEMCCAKHGKADLAKRDIAAQSVARRGFTTHRQDGGRASGGYSRPSKTD